MEKYNYVTKLDVKYDQHELVDIPQIIRENKHKWYNESLTKVNDSVIRIGIVEGEYHWHKHDKDDEFFLVLEGQLFIDFKDKTVTLDPFQGYTIPKGVEHRPRAPKKVVMLMVENKDIEPTGD